MPAVPTTQKRKPRLDLNPSSADRWTTCTASPQFILDNWDKVPPSDTTFSREGTTAHEVASAYLQDREPRTSDPYACPTPVDADMRWHGWNYAEYVQSLRAPGSRLLVEQKLPLWYMEKRNAIVDAAVINPDSLHIIDYKYGMGVAVRTEGNLQATIYAMIVGKPLNLPDSFPVSVHIYQPRRRGAEDSPFHVWGTTWGEIQKHAFSITDAATFIQNKTPQLAFAPSEKACQFCPAKGFCTARPEELTKDIQPLAAIEDTPKHHLPPVKAVTVKQLAAILRHGAQIKKWIDDAHEYALQHMSAGGTIPGHKLVMSRGGNRYWRNPAQVAKLLVADTVLRESEIYEKKLISVAAVEKLLGKNKLSVELTNLIDRPPGKPVIAADDDSRESALIDAATEFSAVEDL